LENGVKEEDRNPGFLGEKNPGKIYS